MNLIATKYIILIFCFVSCLPILAPAIACQPQDVGYARVWFDLEKSKSGKERGRVFCAVVGNTSPDNRSIRCTQENENTSCGATKVFKFSDMGYHKTYSFVTPEPTPRQAFCREVGDSRRQTRCTLFIDDQDSWRFDKSSNDLIF